MERAGVGARRSDQWGRFEIPFNAEGKKWVRLAAWDVATNGALVQ
ncbi:MAG: hypothetical protein ACNS62_07450 [Candidatus Cyclobacteriaceae bacterium M3_2C_046]